MDEGLSNQDLYAGIKILKSGRITMGKQTVLFEKNFAKKLNVKYALMVNSGSSANLLAAFASCNPMRKNRFKKGDHALIQSLSSGKFIEHPKVKYIKTNKFQLEVDSGMIVVDGERTNYKKIEVENV